MTEDFTKHFIKDLEEVQDITDLFEYEHNNHASEQEDLVICEEGYNEIDNLPDFLSEGLHASNDKQLRHHINEAERLKKESLYIILDHFLEIPETIGRLTNLKELNIEIDILCKEDGYVVLPSEIGKLKNLEVLCMYGCKLKSLPQDFSKLTNLKSLNLNGNDFEVFPKEILRLKGLESLAINFCFETLPDEICELTHLRYLYLPDANLTYLPANLGNLHNLEILCIWRTKISQLPESCLKLTKLKVLYLTKSIFEAILPPEIIKQSPIEVINYIIKYQNDAKKVEINESKMIIVGQGGVGKTCLLNRLVYEKYDETASTEGIDIEPWRFAINKKEYKLNVWDFGGQEIYHATHQFFLTNRSLYIFVWDARQEEEYGRIDYWLHTIESFGGNSPIIIVINKCDSRNSIKQLDFKSIKKNFPQIVDYFKVSCKENRGIGNLRNVVQEEAVRLPLMGMVWLSSWLKVRTELEMLAKTKNIIAYKEYLKICRKHNISKEDALSLSKYLHDLGIIINFHNDVYLKDIVILNPDWGTNAVYKVLDAQETILNNRNGILYFSDLPKIWKDTEVYPEDVYPTILRLMENFQLSFEVSKNQEYLIAELLENEEINVEMNFENKKTLNFQYNYEFLPAGILTRFIVRANTYLLENNGKKACWKKGAYLKHEESVGQVKLFDGIAERKIEIKVVGENSRSNRELLVVIRKYFEEIHSNVPKIKVTEYVKCNCNDKCSYLHDYRYLLKLEKESIHEERCRESLKQINVSSLLDGVSTRRKHKSTRRETMGNIQINPHIVVENNNTNSSANSNVNSVNNEITIEIRNNINELQGSIQDLKDEVTYDNPGMEKEFEIMQNSLEKLNNVETKEEVVKSGALNKVKRFLEEIGDGETELGKIVKHVKHGVGIVQEIAEKYNSIAEWCGLPVIPRLLLKK